MLTHAEFLEHLRAALENLYDPDRLCQSPLAGLFGVARRFDAYAALQGILCDAIASLEPKAKTPPQQRAWRIYELLFYRYVQQQTAETVAGQLGVTKRHLRREQRAALEALAYILWQQYGLSGKVTGDPASPAQPEGVQAQAGGSPPATGDAPAPAAPVVHDELAWLRDSPPERPTDLREVLAAVLELLQPLARQYHAHLEVDAAEPLPALSVHQAALNQSLINLLAVAIPRASGAPVRISTRQRHWEVEIEVACSHVHPGHLCGADDISSLDMARQLVELDGGRLTIFEDDAAFHALLSVPAVEQRLVLAIDDNADTLQLLEHYTAGTRYRLSGTRDPEEALALALSLSPQVIVLDVMMPKVDGWRVLGQLRQHPRTGHIPVLVCSILTQEGLARSLGASGLVRKPVTQEAFLAALDRACAPGSEPR